PKVYFIPFFPCKGLEVVPSPKRFLNYLRYSFCTGRVTFKNISGQIFPKCFCNLTATGIVNTDKCYFWLFFHTLPSDFLDEGFCLVLFQNLTIGYNLAIHNKGRGSHHAVCSN